MSRGFNFASVLLISICTFLGFGPDPASALSAELAKKCNALTAKQFPPREVGNPAAGSTKGSGRDQHNFFNKCIASGGKIEEGASK